MHRLDCYLALTLVTALVMIKEETAVVADTPTLKNENLPGILLMMLGIFLMACMDTAAKLVVETNVSPIQIVAIRSWIILPIVIITMLCRRQLHSLKTQRPMAHAIRGSIGVLAPILFFTALKTLPINYSMKADIS